MSEPNSQTQVPGKEGQEQQGLPASAVDLNKALTELAAQLDKDRTARAEVDKKLEQKEKESRKFQSTLDRTKATLPTPQPSAGVQPNRPGVVPSPSNPLQQENADLRNYASQVERENMLLREMHKRGLNEEDIQDLEFETPNELRLALDNIETRKQLRQLQETVEAGAQQEPPKQTAPKPIIDTGGPTGVGGATDDDGRLKKEYERARSLGRTEQGRWALLDAIHKDDSKVVVLRPEPQVKE